MPRDVDARPERQAVVLHGPGERTVASGRLADWSGPAFTTGRRFSQNPVSRRLFSSSHSLTEETRVPGSSAIATTGP